MTAESKRSTKQLRSRFNTIYDSCIVGAGFCESDDYYRFEKERYWRTLELLCQLNIPLPSKILEIGGGQLSVLCKELFADDCTVADISREYIAPLRKAGIELATINLFSAEASNIEGTFDLIILLEVIEHVSVPVYVIIDRIKPYLNSSGVVFLTTPNLFRIRNLVRMFLGIEFLDRFMIPEPEQGIGHFLEYSADHLRWQLERADMEILMLKQDSMGRTGHSAKARLARKLLAPLEWRPVWRKGLAAAARLRTS